MIIANRLYFLLVINFVFFIGCAAHTSLSRLRYVDQTTLRLPLENQKIVKPLFADMDNDQDLDLLLLTTSGMANEQLLFFTNNGRGHFINSTFSRLPELQNSFQDLRMVDVDGNESLDIILLGTTLDNKLSSDLTRKVSADKRRDYLLINNMHGTFIDETPSRLPEIGIGYSELKTADIDNDNDIDLLIYGNNVPTLLFINNGRGVFTNESLSRLPVLDKGIQEALIGDVNGDKYVDLFFAMENKKNILLINDGTGIFSDETETLLPKVLDNSTDAAMGDLDNDGDLDIVVVVDKLSTDRAQTKSQRGLNEYRPFTNTNFEEGKISRGNEISDGWMASGNAWQIWSMNESVNQDRSKPMPEDSMFYALSFTPVTGSTGEAATGTICSKNFTIPFAAKTMSFLITGWDGQFGDDNKNFFRLRRSTDRASTTGCTLSGSRSTPLKEAKPPLTDAWDRKVWDVTDIAGKTVYFEAVDGNNNASYASIGFDNILLSNMASHSERFDREENYLLINNGAGVFEDTTIDMPPTKTSYRVDIFDADNDNDLDVFIVGIYGATLLINDGDGNLRDETYSRLPSDTNFTEIDFGDIDFDGDIDLVGVQQEQAKLIMNVINPKVLEQDIQRLKDLIISFPDTSYAPGRLDNFIEEIGGKGNLIDIVLQAEKSKSVSFYKAAKKRLKEKFLNLSDGCINSGKPDKDDWVADCAAQTKIHSMTLDIIESLDSIINSSL